MYTRNTNSGEIKTTFIAISHVLQGKNILKRSAQKQNNNCTFVAEKREVDGLIFVLKTRKLFNVNIVDKTLEERR